MKPGEEAFALHSVPRGIEFSLWQFRRLLLRARVAPLSRWNEFVLFGSTVLYLHGIRDAESVGDVDVFVTRRVWGELLAQGPDFCVVKVPRAGDPPFLEIGIRKPIHVFYEWTGRDKEWITAEQCFESAEIVNGWPCASLQTIRRHKEKSFEANPDSARHEKHARDLALIDSHLAGVRS